MLDGRPQVLCVAFLATDILPIHALDTLTYRRLSDVALKDHRVNMRSHNHFAQKNDVDCRNGTRKLAKYISHLNDFSKKTSTNVICFQTDPKIFGYPEIAKSDTSSHAKS